MRIPVRAGLDSPALPRRHPARRVLDAALRRRGALQAPRPIESPWDARHFGLDRSPTFAGLDPAQRAAALQECGRGLLEEAYFIEKLGLAFSTKMALLAESTEERATHCLFAADEAVHLAKVASFLSSPPESPGADPFLALLGRIIEDMPPAGSRLLIQILLEGWGIAHYRALARGCRDAGLSEALSSIAKDEVLHHRSGAALFNGRRLAGAERREARRALGELLDMVRAGPLRTVAAVERARGGLTRAQRDRLYRELDGERHVADRLALLRGLLDSAGAGALVA